ncbi:WecB/TagA/CpsF family glycosyltransferase [Erythrobacter sp. NE805]|uniref:WecB/TagA/CpsF family glycosyltransferase n=1 Tax=Erythrobacter sp. NE805 TaxID=3389875 RepID=UPI00396B1CAE
MSAELPSMNFLGLDFVEAPHEQLAAELDRLSRCSGMSLVVTPNVEHVVMLRGKRQPGHVEQRFSRAYGAASLRLCDSRVLRGLAWVKGIKLTVLTGSDVTALLFEQGWLDNRKVALIGGDANMPRDLKARFPSVDVVQHIPPMGVLDNEPAIERIEEFLKSEQWEYILFAIGAPRSEIIAHRVMATGSVTGVAFCLGASIEFMLGRKRRAPRWMQLAGLEWVFRLLTEPRRLWRRYLIEGPKIISIMRAWRPS